MSPISFVDFVNRLKEIYHKQTLRDSFPFGSNPLINYCRRESSLFNQYYKEYNKWENDPIHDNDETYFEIMDKDFSSCDVEEYMMLVLAYRKFTKHQRNSNPSKVKENLEGNTQGYFYWVTLTPEIKPNYEQNLRKFCLRYLKEFNLLGCFERGTNGNYHTHIVLHLKEKLDQTKSPWRFIKKNYHFMPIYLKTYSEVLVKCRYVCTTDKSGTKHGIYGDYEYFNKICKENTNQIILKNKPQVIKEISNIIEFN